MKIKAKTNTTAAIIIVTAIIFVTYLMTYGVHATTISSQSGYVDVDENGNYYYVSPFEYGEIKDGLFVRTLHEEFNSIEFLRDEYQDLYLKEYDKMVQARWLDEMTPEMIADGGYYQTRPGGLVSMQADIDYDNQHNQGDVGEGNNVMDFNEATDPYGYVTIIAEVDPEIEENEAVCYIQLENLDTGEWSEPAELLAINHYTKTAWKLPVGTYRVADGGIYEDYAGRYPLNDLTGEFVLQDGGSAQVRVTIGDVSGGVSETTAAETTGAETEPEPETMPIQTLPEIEETEEAIEEESGISAAVVIAVVIVIVLVVVIVIVIMRSRRSNWK